MEMTGIEIVIVDLAVLRRWYWDLLVITGPRILEDALQMVFLSILDQHRHYGATEAA